MSIKSWMDTEDVVHVENGILLIHRKEFSNAVSSNKMQLDILILSEVSQKDKNHMIHLHVGSKIWHKWTYLHNRSRCIYIEKRLVAKWEKGVSGMNGEFGVSKWKLLHLEWINNEVLLYNTVNYIHSLGIDHDGR